MTDCSTNTIKQRPYIGRFAPSPTGPLHLGSLFCAVASWLHARQHNGQWLIRMEDLDPPREQPQAAEHILQTLAAYGLESDQTVLFQSTRHQAYETALSQLLDANMAYRCYCSRKQIADAGLANPKLKGPEGWRYNGHCRRAHPENSKAQHSIRLNSVGADICFIDELQGSQQENPESLYGDFPLKRADGFYAYQLAVVVDDAFQGVTHIVRGIDLLSSTSRQIRLQQKLGLAKTYYCHLPVLTGGNGQKLSKQNLAPALAPTYQAKTLYWILTQLGAKPPSDMNTTSATEMLQWAIEHWDSQALSNHKDIAVSPQQGE